MRGKLKSEQDDNFYCLRKEMNFVQRDIKRILKNKRAVSHCGKQFELWQEITKSQASQIYKT